MNRDLKHCPCCGNHCKVSELSCERGKKYFGTTTNEQISIDEKKIENIKNQSM